MLHQSRGVPPDLRHSPLHNFAFASLWMSIDGSTRLIARIGERSDQPDRTILTRSCPKCGKRKIKTRKGVARCPRCGVIKRIDQPTRKDR